MAEAKGSPYEESSVSLVRDGPGGAALRPRRNRGAGVRTGTAREGLAPPSAPGCQEVEGAPRAGTVSWWTKKPLSPDAEEMEQG